MIRGLEGFLHDAHLLQEESLNALKNTRLGIDLSYYLRQVLSAPESAEPLVTAIGGQPIALMSRIESDIRVLEQHRLQWRGDDRRYARTLTYVALLFSFQDTPYLPCSSPQSFPSSPSSARCGCRATHMIYLLRTRTQPDDQMPYTYS